MIEKDWATFAVKPSDKRPYAPWGDIEAGEKRPVLPGQMIAVATGARSGGLVIVDCDEKVMPDGREAHGLANFMGLCSAEQLEYLSTTRTSQTPRGGVHFLFRTPTRIGCSTSIVVEGVDIRGEGGYAAIPPSVRNDGVPYKWINEHGVQTMPAWLEHMILTAHARATSNRACSTGPGDTLAPAQLTDLATRLARKDKQLAEALRAVLRGDPWSDHGTRDDVLWRLTGAIFRAFPTADPSAVAAHFAASCALYPDFLFSVVEEKCARRRREVDDANANSVERALADRATAIRSATNNRRSEPFSESEIEAYLAEKKLSHDALKKQWIVQTERSWYFLDLDAGYQGPYGRDTAYLAAHKHLAASPIQLTRTTPQGISAPREVRELALECGSIATHVVADFRASRATFDGRTLREAPCPRRALEPEHNADVHTWLTLLGGARWPAFEQWIAWGFDLSRASAALYLQGIKGVGKSLFALGYSRAWGTDGPTTLEQAMGAFNGAMLRCPVVFADEKTPHDFRGRSRTAELRELIQSTVRPLRRKFLDDAECHGALRIILAANGRNLVSSDETLTKHDIDAIAERFVHLVPSEDAVDFLQAKDTWRDGWIERDVIAKHLLWIAANVEREAKPSRFLVTTEGSALAKNMATSSTSAAAVAHWLLSWLLNPRKLTTGNTADSSAYMLRVHNGAIVVNARAIVEHWDKYPTNVDARDATIRRVGIALTGLALSDRVMLPTGRDTPRAWFHVLDLSLLRAWAETSCFCTDEQITGAIKAIDNSVDKQ